MRIATWNVNSLKARQEAVEKWLARAEPDVLLIQETKLSDADAPVMPFRMLGYELVHHGEGRWNGVAILSRVGLEDVVTNFGDGPVRDSSAGATVAVSEDDFDPFDEARMVSAVCGGVRVVSPVRPERPRGGLAVLRGQAALVRAARALAGRDAVARRAARPGRRLQRDPGRRATSGARRGRTAARTCRSRSARRWRRLRAWGLVDTYRTQRPEAGRFSWWDYRAGMFHRNEGMRIDLLYATAPVASRVVWAEIDREARKGPPTPSDHAPVVIDLDEPGLPFDAGWDGRARADRRADEAPPLRVPAHRASPRRAADPGRSVSGSTCRRATAPPLELRRGVTDVVPASPRSIARVGERSDHREPRVGADEPARGLDLRAHRARRERTPVELVGRCPTDRLRRRGAPVRVDASTSVSMRNASAWRAVASSAPARSLSMTASIPSWSPSGPHDRDAAASRADDDHLLAHQQVDDTDLEDRPAAAVTGPRASTCRRPARSPMTSRRAWRSASSRS